jgi:TatD DNase family protein
MTIEDLERVEKQGFKLLLTSGIDLASSEQAISTAQRHKIAKGCIGVHPWHADEYNSSVEMRFTELAENLECIAISEIGLDFVGRMTHEWIREDRFIEPQIQYKTLDSQLGLARELGLPALIHDRAPNMEILEILEKSGNANIGLAIHGFSKNIDYARRCVDNGIYLSVGLRTIQDSNPSFINAIKETPLEYLLTETDSSKPEGVLTVCKIIGEIKETSREEVGKITTKNLMRLCNI